MHRGHVFMLVQVTDMMVANSANLIVTVKPVNQRNNITGRGGGIASIRSSVKSTTSYLSAKSHLSTRDSSDEVTRLADGDGDEDLVKSHLMLSSVGKLSAAAGENVLATV